MNTESAVRAGVLLMAYGGPRSLDEVEPFLRSLTGREPTPETLERVWRRYLTIGGKSPLPQIAGAFAAELEERLARDGLQAPVGVGFRYTEPSIGTVLAQLHSLDVKQVVAVSLSPFESETTSVAYRAAIDEALASMPGMTVIDAPQISTLREFEILLAGGVAVALEHLPEEVAGQAILVFTAHSLPVSEGRVAAAYQEGLRNLADRVAMGLGLALGAEFADVPQLPGVAAYGSFAGDRPWLLAYQSKGERPGEWLGPQLGEVIEAVAKSAYPALVVQPIGFVTDHLETLYDLDVEAGGMALDLGLEFGRGDVPNASPVLVEGVALAIEAALGFEPSGSGDQVSSPSPSGFQMWPTGGAHGGGQTEQ